MLVLWLILLPLLGGAACLLSERVSAELPRRVALLVTGATLLLALILWCRGNYSVIGGTYPQWQAEFSVNWIERFGIRFHLALDGLSILMVVLTALMGVIAVLASYREETSYKRPGWFYFCLSMTVAGVMGVFTAIDLFFFFFFWELMLIPMYFMIAVWGNSNSSQGKRFNGATKFFIYTQASGLILLLAILSLVLLQYQANGVWSFAYADLLRFATTGGVSSATLMAVMIGFFIAFAVKMPIIPVHGWLADAHEQAPTAGSIDITGLLLKTAAYGMLRFSIPFFPAASSEFAPIAMGLGLFGLFYGAWLAFGQTNIKRLIAYTSVSHMGLVTIAIYSGSLLAYQGAVVQMVAHGISAAGLFVVCGILYARLKTFDMREMGGLWGRIRYLPAFSLLFAVATLGMPGTGNFVGEFLMFFGAFKTAPVVIIIAAFGMVFAAIYALALVQRVYFGSAQKEAPLQRLSVREFMILLVLALILVFIGLYPQVLLNTAQGATVLIAEWFNSFVPHINSIAGR